MLHTLKTLYKWCAKHNPEIINNLTHLHDYCYNTQLDNTNSLQWFIYKLRKKLPQQGIQNIFLACIKEAYLRKNENMLYCNILSLNSAKKYKSLLLNSPSEDVKP